MRTCVCVCVHVCVYMCVCVPSSHRFIVCRMHNLVCASVLYVNVSVVHKNMPYDGVQVQVRNDANTYVQLTVARLVAL